MLIPWGLATSFPVVLPAAGSTDLQASPTISAGDFKISIDGGAFANLATLPSVSPAAGRQVVISLGASETEMTYAIITAVDGTSPKEWRDNSWRIWTPKFEGALCGKITSGSPTTTAFVSSQLAGTNADQYADAYVSFLSGTCAGAIKKITAFNAGTDTVTCNALPAAPSVGDVFIIVNGA